MINLTDGYFDVEFASADKSVLLLAIASAPRLIKAPEAVVVPVPPFATEMAVPLQVPDVIVPAPLMVKTGVPAPFWRTTTLSVSAALPRRMSKAPFVELVMICAPLL